MDTLQVPTSPLPVPIDPRLRQRRIEVRRKEGRRRLRVLLAVVALVVLTLALWLATRSSLLDVDAVEVEGSSRTPASTISEAGRLVPGMAMTDIDEEAAVRRIEALPWVAEVGVTRRWPGTVSVRLTERTALAVVGDGTGTWWLVDASGRVLEGAGTRPDGPVALEGVSQVPQPGEVLIGTDAALAVAAALSPALAAQVDAVVAVDGGGVDLRLKPHGVVRLGTPNDLDAKLQATEAVLAQVDPTGLAVLDVQLPTSPVLTRE
jgi:cell division protein FtsQ